MIGGIVGFCIAFPAWNADSTWREALQSKQIDKVVAVAKKWPLDSRRLAEISVILDNNKLSQYSKQVNAIAIKYNPNYYDAWRAVLANTSATETEKKIAKENLKRLDPLNPQWK